MAAEKTNESNPSSGKSSTLPTMIISGFVGLVVIAETMIFFFMVPSGDEVAALAESRLIKKIEASMSADGEELAKADEDKVVEFPLGEYGVSFIPPGTDRPHRVEFRLFGTIKRKDQKHLEALYAERQGRFRHRMILEVRNATMDELTENQLGLIQRRILATSNELLEEPILLGVGFHDYQVTEE
jgi:hypothetical protein